MWLIKVHTWSVEKHSIKCYAYLNKKISCYTLPKGSFVTSNAAGLAAVPHSQSRFTIQSVAYHQNMTFHGPRPHSFCLMLQ